MLSNPNSAFDSEEFIDLDLALAEEELRSLGSTPEYNSRTNNLKLSFKSIDDQETERFRLSLITPLSKYPSVRSSTKSPADSYAESVALFKDLSTQENTDFASKDLKDFMPYDMDDLMSRTGSQAYTARTPPIYRDSFTSTHTQRKSNNSKQPDNRRWSSYEPQSSSKQRPLNIANKCSSLLAASIPERKKNILPSEIPRRRTVLRGPETVPRRQALSHNKNESDSHHTIKHEPQLIQRRHTLHYEQEPALRRRTLSNEQEAIQRRQTLSGNKAILSSHYRNKQHEPQQHTLHYEQGSGSRCRTLSNEREPIQPCQTFSNIKDNPDSHCKNKQHETQQHLRQHSLHYKQSAGQCLPTLSNERESVQYRQALSNNKEALDSHYSSQQHKPQQHQRRHSLHYEQETQQHQHHYELEAVSRRRTLSDERESTQCPQDISNNKDEPDTHYYNMQHKPQRHQRLRAIHYDQEAVAYRRNLANERRQALSKNKDEPDSHYSNNQHEPQQHQRLHHKQESIQRRRTLSHEQESIPHLRSLVYEKESIPRRRTLSDEQVKRKQTHPHNYALNNDKQRVLPHRYTYKMHQPDEKAEIVSHGRQMTVRDRQVKQTEMKATEPTRYPTKAEPKPSMMPVPVSRYRKHNSNYTTHNSKYVSVPENSGISSFNVAPTKDVRFAPSVHNEEVQVVPSRSSGGLSNSTESTSQSGDLYYDPPTPPSTNRGLSTVLKRRSMPVIERTYEDEVTASARKVLEQVRQRRRERSYLLS